MKAMTGKFLEDRRLLGGPFASNRDAGFNGAFFIELPNQPDHGEGSTKMFTVICSDGMGWEHVSVSLPDRCPTWEEMCYVRSLFWDEHEWVVQFHPPRSQNVNLHPYCLHLWKPTCAQMPVPPAWMVGPKKGATQ